MMHDHPRASHRSRKQAQDRDLILLAKLAYSVYCDVLATFWNSEPVFEPPTAGRVRFPKLLLLELVERLVLLLKTT